MTCPKHIRIADLDVEATSNDHQSLDHVPARFAKVLEEADQALMIGMQNYEQIETEQRFGRMGHPS